MTIGTRFTTEAWKTNTAKTVNRERIRCVYYQHYTPVVKRPPSTGREAPVILPAAGEQRKATARPMSSGVPRRCKGILALRLSDTLPTDGA